MLDSSLSTDQWFSPGMTFSNVWRHAAVTTAGNWGVAIGVWWAVAKDVPKRPTMYRTALVTNYPALSNNSNNQRLTNCGLNKTLTLKIAQMHGQS